MLQKPGYEKIDVFADGILNLMQENNGFLSLTDKSQAEEIYLMCGMSKKNIKKSIGSLYKRKLIELVEKGIRLIG